MNENNYEKWLKEKLILKISPNSIIVSDKASYLSILVEKTPSTNFKERQWNDWQKDSLLFKENVKANVICPHKIAQAKNYKIPSW